LKAGEHLRVSGYIIRKKLEGDKATQLDVLGLVHNAHTAATKLFKDAVV
jgi:hypothetical protein